MELNCCDVVLQTIDMLAQTQGPSESTPPQVTAAYIQVAGVVAGATVGALLGGWITMRRYPKQIALDIEAELKKIIGRKNVELVYREAEKKQARAAKVICSANDAFSSLKRFAYAALDMTNDELLGELDPVLEKFSVFRSEVNTETDLLLGSDAARYLNQICRSFADTFISISSSERNRKDDARKLKIHQAITEMRERIEKFRRWADKINEVAKVDAAAAQPVAGNTR